MKGRLTVHFCRRMSQILISWGFLGAESIVADGGSVCFFMGVEGPPCHS